MSSNTFEQDCGSTYSEAFWWQSEAREEKAQKPAQFQPLNLEWSQHQRTEEQDILEMGAICRRGNLLQSMLREELRT